MLTCEIVSARAIILLYNMLIIDSNQAHDTTAMVTITKDGHYNKQRAGNKDIATIDFH